MIRKTARGIHFRRNRHPSGSGCPFGVPTLRNPWSDGTTDRLLFVLGAVALVIVLGWEAVSYAVFFFRIPLSNPTAYFVASAVIPSSGGTALILLIGLGNPNASRPSADFVPNARTGRSRRLGHWACHERLVLYRSRRSGVRVATLPFCAHDCPRFDRPIPAPRLGTAPAERDAFLAAFARATLGTHSVSYLAGREPFERMVRDERPRDSECEEGEARFAVRRKSCSDHKGQHKAREESPHRNNLDEHDQETQHKKEHDDRIEGRQREVGEERHPPSTDASTLLNVMETRASHAGRGPPRRAPSRSSRAG